MYRRSTDGKLHPGLALTLAVLLGVACSGSTPEIDTAADLVEPAPTAPPATTGPSVAPTTPPAPPPTPAAEEAGAAEESGSADWFHCLDESSSQNEMVKVVMTTGCLEDYDLGDAYYQCQADESARLGTEYEPAPPDAPPHDIFIESTVASGIVSQQILDGIRTVAGIEEARGAVVAFGAILLDGNDMRIGEPTGPVSILADWPSLNPVVAQGRPPAEPGEFVVDASAVERGDLELGQHYDIMFESTLQEFELVGVTEPDGFSGISLRMHLDDAVQLVHDGLGYDAIMVLTSDPVHEVLPLVNEFLTAGGHAADGVDSKAAAELEAADRARDRLASNVLNAGMLCLPDDARAEFVSDLAQTQVSPVAAYCVLNGLALHPLFDVPPLDTCL